MSLPAIALVLVLALSGTAFTPTHPAPGSKIATASIHHWQNVPFVKHYFDLSYYWFWYPDDTYNDYETAYWEEYELNEFYYPGVEIDTNPMGGSLLMKGYQLPNQPHMGFPSIYLYAHFTN